MKKSNGKNILAVIVCLVAYVLLVFISEFVGYISPLLWVGVSVIAAFFGAFPMTYLMARIQKPFVALGTALVWALFMLLSGGLQYPAMIVYPIVVGIAAEIVHRALGYDTVLGLRASYAVLSLITFAQMLNLWTSTDAYIAQAVEEMGSEAYGAALQSYANAGALVLILVLTLVVGFASTFVTAAVFKKPMEKYGLR